jgi:hypothetical protein
MSPCEQSLRPHSILHAGIFGVGWIHLLIISSCPLLAVLISSCNSIPATVTIATAGSVSPHDSQEVQAVPFGLIEKLAVDMAAWHFDSSDDVDPILKEARALGIAFSAQDLNSILDEDERKRLWRVGAAEYHIGRLYGEEAQAVFKIRHYVSLAGLWEKITHTAVTPAERKGYIMIAAGNIGIAARALREVPANWDCWDVTACEPRPPMRAVTFAPDNTWISEGTNIYEELLDLSRAAEPDLDLLDKLMEQARAWDERVCDSLAGGD